MELTRIIAILITILLLFSVMIITFQEHLIYPGYYKEIIPLKNNTIKKTINGSYYKKGNTGELYIFFGGNGSLPQDYEKFINDRDSFILLNYPGFGNSEGRTNPETSTELLDKIFKKHNKYENINFMCYSIGCGICLHYLCNRPNIMKKTRKMYLLAPFWSLDEVANNRYVPHFPNELVLNVLTHNWENYKYIPKIKKNIDITIIHGSNDLFITCDQGLRLSKLRKGTKFITTDDSHGTIVDRFQHLV